MFVADGEESREIFFPGAQRALLYPNDVPQQKKKAVVCCAGNNWAGTGGRACKACSGDSSTLKGEEKDFIFRQNLTPGSPWCCGSQYVILSLIAFLERQGWGKKTQAYPPVELGCQLRSFLNNRQDE